MELQQCHILVLRYFTIWLSGSHYCAVSKISALLQAIKSAEEHITAVTKERSYYRTVCEESKKNITALYSSTMGSFEPPPPYSMIGPLSNDTTIHYSFDMAQQVLKSYNEIVCMDCTLLLGPLPE